MRDHAITLAGEPVRLLAERALYWERGQLLVVADLHWGKSEVLQAGGVGLPSGALELDLTRLAHACQRVAAKRLLVLGDLVHAPSGITAQVADTVSAWRASLELTSFAWIRGNHDRRLRVPESWGLKEVASGSEEGPWRLVHEQSEAASGFSLSGHLHPAVVVRGGGDRLRLPCFYQRRRGLILPAFGMLTGHYLVAPGRGEKVYAIAGDSVLPV